MKSLLMIMFCLLLGCAKGFTDPELKVAVIQLSDINTEYSTFEVSMNVKNPNDVRVDISAGKATFMLGSVKAESFEFAAFELGAKKDHTVPVTVKIPTNEVLDTYGSPTVPYTLTAEIHAQDKWDEQKSFTVEMKGEYEIAPQLELLLKDPEKDWLRLRLREN